ncbi:MAG: glycosyltransferase family 4 protein [Bacillota bacterium]|nr:glycosyltransferase family 4 protein [Bacillota bacterium]
MKDINILHVTNFHNIGGIESRLIDFFSEPAENFRFFVFSPNPIMHFYERALKSLRIIYGQKSEKRPWISELVYFAKTHHIDIVHFHRPWSKAKLALKEAGIQAIIDHDHGASWLSTDQQIKQDRPSIKVVDRVIAVSEASKIMLSQRVGYKPRNIQVIHNGVQFSRFTNCGSVFKTEHKSIITTICRLISLKGVESLIRAIPHVISQNPNIDFWIVGDGPKRLAYKELAIKLGVKDKVKFWGAQEDVSDILAATDIFVLPSVREPFGGVLIEAGYFGKPCIAANVDGNPEIVIHEKTGLLLDPTLPFVEVSEKGNSVPCWVVDGNSHKLRRPLALHPKTLANAIIQLISDAEAMHEFGENARERVVRQFNIQRYHQEILALYNSLTKR